MRKAPLILLGLFSIAVVGCSSGPSVDGKWNVTGMKGLPPGSTFSATFSKPDKVAMVMDMSQEIPGAKPLKIHADIDATYKITGEIMDVHVVDAKFKADGAPDVIKKQVDDQMKTMGDQVKAEVNKNGKQKMKWNGPDSFTLSGANGSEETYTRVK